MKGFPFDGIDRPGIGRFRAFIISAHPLIFYGTAVIIGLILGYFW